MKESQTLRLLRHHQRGYWAGFYERQGAAPPGKLQRGSAAWRAWLDGYDRGLKDRGFYRSRVAPLVSNG